jgi:hypothetical protein
MLKKVTFSPNAILAVLLIGLMLTGAVMAQLNQSGGGGSSVTLQPGSNLAGKFGIDQTTPGTTNGVSLANVGSTAIATGNGVSGAGVQRVNIASDNTAFAVNATVSAALPAGTNLLGSVYTIPKTTCGSTPVGIALGAVPTSSTLATSAVTTCVIAIALNNTTASNVTVTVSDNQGTPVNMDLTFTLPPGEKVTPLFGIPFTSGVKWSASVSGVTGGLVGIQ